MNVVSIYCDGGCCLSNPSPYCAQWAYCHVDENDVHVQELSGIILRASNPDAQPVSRPGRVIVVPSGEINPNGLTNQLSELIALTLAVESLPDAWNGRVYSDSESALGRMFGTTTLGGIPEEWRYRCRIAPERLGNIVHTLMGGHPTEDDLTAGIRKARKGKRALPCSPHQNWCDLECVRLGRRFAELLRMQGKIE